MELKIGQIIFDKDGAKVEVLNITNTSVQLYIKAKKETGTDSKDWLPLGKDFDLRFKIKL